MINNRTHAERVLNVSGFFVAIGLRHKAEIFNDWLYETGYIKTRPGSASTNVEGIFCCGDSQDHVYRRAVSAAGSGCMAAIDAERYLTTWQHTGREQ